MLIILIVHQFANYKVKTLNLKNNISLILKIFVDPNGGRDPRPPRFRPLRHDHAGRSREARENREENLLPTSL